MPSKSIVPASLFVLSCIGSSACGGTAPPATETTTPRIAPTPVIRSTEHPEQHQTLTPTRIRAEIGSHHAEIQACYNGALARNPSHHGNVTVFFEIAPDGRVLRSNVQENTMGDDEAARCLLAVVAGIRFPETGMGLIETRYAFDFREIDRDGDGVQ